MHGRKRAGFIRRLSVFNPHAALAAGLVDADLGGRVYKKRVPLPGRGKRGGARTLIGADLGDRWFFLFGFEKKRARQYR